MKIGLISCAKKKKPYREFLIPLVENVSEVMLEHSGIGRRLKFYISNISP